MDRTWHTRSTLRAGEDKNIFKHSWLILGPKMAHFCPKNCDFDCFWDKWGHFYTFLISKMDETWLTSPSFKADKDKNSFGHSDSFWGQKWPIFASKTAFLAHFKIIDGISLLFQYPIWMKLGLLHQLLRLTTIKTVSDTSASFWAKNGPFLFPKLRFWLILR